MNFLQIHTHELNIIDTNPPMVLSNWSCLDIWIFFFLPEALKLTELSIPLYLGDNGGDGTQGNVGQQPYRELSVTITLELPSITIHPHEILLPPVPLRSKIETSLTLLVVEYPRLVFFTHTMCFPLAFNRSGKCYI